MIKVALSVNINSYLDSVDLEFIMKKLQLVTQKVLLDKKLPYIPHRTSHLSDLKSTFYVSLKMSNLRLKLRTLITQGTPNF